MIFFYYRILEKVHNKTESLELVNKTESLELVNKTEFVQGYGVVDSCIYYKNQYGDFFHRLNCFIVSIVEHPNFIVFGIVFLLVVFGCCFVDCLRCCDCEIVLIVDHAIYRIKKRVYRIIFCGYEDLVMDIYENCMDALDCFHLFCFCLEDDEDDEEEG